MSTLLGERFTRLSGALPVLGVGTLVLTLIAVPLGAVYIRHSDYPLARELMQGARAGALAVFTWAIAGLLRPQLNGIAAAGVALVTFAMTLLPVPSL